MHYKIAGQKLWSVNGAKFIGNAPENIEIQELYNGEDLMDEDGLRDWLAARGEPLGELQVLEDVRAAKLAEVMAGYDAAFAPIEAAYPAKERET